MNIEAFFKISYGLYVVSSEFENKLNGFISNTVFQVTAEPAQFAAACNKNNFTAELITKSKHFSVSVLEKNTRPDIISIFGYKSGKDIDKFSGFNYKTGLSGIPILIDDTIAYFEFEVVNNIDVGSHLLFIAKTTNSEIINIDKEPLTYAYYRDVKKGKAPKNAPTYISQDIKTNIISDIYYCPACGYEYIPEKGDIISGIPAFTEFKDLPSDWKCPVCGLHKSDFIKK